MSGVGALKAVCRTFTFYAAVASLDFWLWPQMFTEKLMYYDNQTQMLVQQRPDFEHVRSYIDDFFDQWHTNTCYTTQDCDFIMFLMVYVLFSMSSVSTCAMLQEMPRGCMSFSVGFGTIMNIFHSYIVRGRFIQPDSLVLWGAQLGILSGTTTWGCICYVCETIKEPVRIVAPANP